MFYYMWEYMKWLGSWGKTTPEEPVDPLSEIIKKRALEQNSIIENKGELLPNPISIENIEDEDTTN